MAVQIMKLVLHIKKKKKKNIAESKLNMIVTKLIMDQYMFQEKLLDHQYLKQQPQQEEEQQSQV